MVKSNPLYVLCAAVLIFGCQTINLAVIQNMNAVISFRKLAQRDDKDRIVIRMKST